VEIVDLHQFGAKQGEITDNYLKIFKCSSTKLERNKENIRQNRGRKGGEEQSPNERYREMWNKHFISNMIYFAILDAFDTNKWTQESEMPLISMFKPTFPNLFTVVILAQMYPPPPDLHNSCFLKICREVL
jgi:hypothetical protein